MDGIEGLSERSRAPREHPQAVSAAIAERCLAVRRTHPTWGPVKVPASRAGRARREVAGGEHDRGTVRSRGGDGQTQAASSRAAVARPFAACGEANAAVR
jgi:putative transposase